jgi:hypothetical protein
MAREFAQIRLELWADPDIRKLTERAQRLYLFLLTNPSLTYAGISDWRPAKLSGFAADSTAATIREAAHELAAGLFVVIDEDTEEIMIRSFLRHDGLLKQPRVAVSMSTAYASTASPKLRGVIVHELSRLRSEHPEWAAWERPQVQVILRHEAIDPKGLEVPQPDDLPPGQPLTLPIALPQTEPNAKGLPTPSPAPATSPTPFPKGNKKRETRERVPVSLPADFTVTESMATWARTNARGIDPTSETEHFKDWHLAKGSKFKDWGAAWRTWMRRSVEYGKNNPAAVAGGKKEWW